MRPAGESPASQSRWRVSSRLPVARTKGPKTMLTAKTIIRAMRQMLSYGEVRHSVPRDRLGEPRMAFADTSDLRAVVRDHFERGGELGPQVRPVEDVPSLHGVVLEHFRPKQ